jgi:FG-GAP repeat/Secretion system C-terminal sorting domain
MKSILLAISILFAVNLSAQNFIEMIKGVASDRAEDDRLGYAVSIDGNWAAIGAYGDDYSGVDPNMGSVYIFQQQGLNNWVQVQKLSASDQDDYDRFGWSVDLHGDLLVIGAYGEDEDEFDSNPMSKAGSAYFFQNVSGTWVEMQKVVASDREADDEFGWSVALYDSTAIIGAHIEDHDEFGANFMYHSGSVYSFVLGTDGVWTETQKIVPNDRWVDINFPNGYSGEDLADQFGVSVGLWGDWLIVGAFHHDYATVSPLSGGLWSSGAAYIFERSGGVWTEVNKIQNFDRESWDRFGYAVAIDSNMIAVCAYSEDEVEDGVSNPLTNPGSVYLWERDSGGSWNWIQKIVPNDRSSGDHFGYSIDIDDTLMVLGCHSDDHDEFAADVKADAGSAYIFEKNGGVWSQLQKIDASDRAIGDDLGISVGISGYTILVGAEYQDFNSVGVDSLDNAGAGYFYSNKICPTLNFTEDVSICFGTSYTIGSSIYTVSGNYTDVLSTISGCDSTINTNLTVEAEITTNVNASMCDGGVYYINGVGVSVPGNYLHNLTAVNGCDSTIITTLTMDAPIISEQWVSICWGETYSIGTNNYVNSGTYQDVVSATNFCDSTITTYLTVELPLDMSISQNASELTSNESGDTYQWIECISGAEIVGATNKIFNATAVGSYGVIVGKNGCSDTSACVFVDELIVGLENSLLFDAISIYPNPSQESFNIELNIPIEEDNKLNIYNLSGEIVFSTEFQKSIVTNSTLVSGTYIIEIINGSAIARKSLVIL